MNLSSKPLLDIVPTVSSSVHCRYYNIGLKVFDNVEAAEMSISRQRMAFAVKAAPPVFSDLSYVSNLGICYLTGHAVKAVGLKDTDRNNWELNLDIPEFSILSEKIQRIIPGYKDLHSSNVGIWNGSMVCIDFFDGS